MKIKLPVVWQVSGWLTVEADSILSAVNEFEELTRDAPLPKDGQYVDGSFELTDGDVDTIAAMTDPKDLVGAPVVVQGASGKIIAALGDGHFVIDLDSGLRITKAMDSITFI